METPKRVPLLSGNDQIMGPHQGLGFWASEVLAGRGSGLLAAGLGTWVQGSGMQGLGLRFRMVSASAFEALESCINKP